MLSAENIQKNYEKHVNIINHYIGDRKDAVLSMLKHMEDNYVMAPASGRTWYHNAFAGGYVDHVNRVIQYALEQHKLYEKMGGNIDYTEEELVFSALFHDLGFSVCPDNHGEFSAALLANYISGWLGTSYSMRS